MLDQDAINLVNNIAEKILRTYDIQIPISDIESVVDKLGGKVIEDPVLSMYSDGFIEKKGDSFAITVSPSQTNERRNFTIAHELGHLFLHMNFANKQKWAKQQDIQYHRYGNSVLEYQANEFAAAFLMPKNEYKQVMDHYTDDRKVSTEKIAEYFNVSVNAASNRGKWLGYLEW